MRESVAVGTRVYLRHPRARDERAAVDAALRSQEHLHPWVFPPASTAEYRGHLQRGERLDCELFHIVTRDGDEIAGFINVNNIVHGNLQSAVLGYGAFLPHAGTGLMGEAMALVLHTAFTSMALHRVEANIQPGNARSRRLVERTGFRLEGYSPEYLRVDGAWRDHERWAITRRAWEAARDG